MSEMELALDFGREPHTYRFGSGVLNGLGARLLGHALRAPAAIVVDVGLLEHVLLETVALGLEDHGLRPFVVPVDGERDKSLAGAEAVWTRFAQAGVERGGVVVALGGGAVGDLAGFCAHGWHRGVALVQAPTTLLAMADSAVGGKTAVNLPAGKNLVGAFHLPLEVAADRLALETLPARDIASGMAEVLKCALLSDPDALSSLADRADAVFDREEAVLADALRLAVTTKVRLAAGDLHDRNGSRALLNLGHLVGHALETETGHATLRHGEAVAVGLVAAARVAEARGLFDGTSLAALQVALAAFRLPLSPPAGTDPDALLACTRKDKKRRAGRTRMVLPKTGGGAELAEVGDDELLAVLRDL